MPAIANADFKYGASNSVYRVELTVSGRITAMVPLPLATTLFKYFMVDILVLKVLSETVGVLALLTAGNMAAATLPTKVTDARILAVLKFISPTLF